MNPKQQQIAREMSAVFARAREQATTQVDVLGVDDDSELGDHLWMRLAAIADGEAGVRSLSDYLRAFYVTRLFEREFASGGTTGFLDWSDAVGHLVSDGYRRLGLTDPADAFEVFWSSTLVKRLIREPSYDPTDEEIEEADALATAVGDHDAERIAFVRAHPIEFSV